MSTDAELARASFRLMTREPFFGHVFSGMLRDVTTTVPSITIALAPGHMPRLRVDPAWWAAHATDPDRQVGLIKHQMLHMVLEHVLREGDFRHRQLFWIAADLVVNQYLDDRYLAPDDITLARFPELGLPAGESVEFYYDRLLAATHGGRPDAPGGGDARGDGEPSDGDDARPGLGEMLRDGHPALDQHIGWQQFTDQRATDRQVVRQFIVDAARRSVRRTPPETYDTLPASLRRHIAGLCDVEPAVDWRRVFKLFVGASRRTYLKNTLRRPSKRYGTVPGIKVRRRHRVVVAVDTSGSMTDAILQRVFTEVHHIYRHGAEVTVVECDADIRDTWAYRGTPPTAASGGGGTDLDPPIAWANTLSPRPDALIYLTDGYAAAPRSTPRMPALWLITPGGITPDHDVWHALPGRRVAIPAV